MVGEQLVVEAAVAWEEGPQQLLVVVVLRGVVEQLVPWVVVGASKYGPLLMVFPGGTPAPSSDNRVAPAKSVYPSSDNRVAPAKSVYPWALVVRGKEFSLEKGLME